MAWLHALIQRRWLFVAPLALALAASPSRAQQPAPTSEPLLPRRSLTPLARAQARYLIICADGVGYDLIEEMYRRGELRHFYPPAPLITAFPTLSNTSLVEILAPLGAPPARGYEDYYFDPEDNKLHGGFFHRFSRRQFVDTTYRALFHYYPHPIGMTFEYALPVFGPWLGGLINLARIKRNFRDSDEPVFLAYLDSTDPAAHVSGKWLLRDLVRRIDRLAGHLVHTSAHPVEVIVFSDHGNQFHRMRKAKLTAALARAGFRVEKELEEARSVVLPKYGLIGSAVLYTHPGQERPAALALTEATGVDFVVYRCGNALHILSAAGEARLLRHKAWFRYETRTADPLQLDAIQAHLRDEGRMDASGFVHQDDWVAATAGHIYPDPLRRLWNAFEGLIVQPASLIVSLQDGYYTGNTLLDIFAVLRTTHGNLRRAQSLGFAMSTAGRLPNHLRGSDFWGAITRQRARAWENLRLPARPCLTSARAAAPAPLTLTRLGSATD